MPARVSLYPNGISVGFVGAGNPDPPPRGQTTGWNAAVSSRLQDFLMRVRVKDLTGAAVSLSLTVRLCPPSADDFAAVRKKFFRAIRSLGFTRWMWVMEWQKRGVPHLHLIVFGSPPLTTILDLALSAAKQPPISDGARLIRIWLNAARDYRPGRLGQDAKQTYAVGGWLEYMMKHMARGVFHAQRSEGFMPDGWEKSGRVWGYGGDWDSVLEDAHATNGEVKSSVVYQLRRAIRRKKLANIKSRLPQGFYTANNSLPNEGMQLYPDKDSARLEGGLRFWRWRLDVPPPPGMPSLWHRTFRALCRDWRKEFAAARRVCSRGDWRNQDKSRFLGVKFCDFSAGEDWAHYYARLRVLSEGIVGEEDLRRGSFAAMSVRASAILQELGD